MTFNKHINRIRTEMANDHLFASVKSFRFSSCVIPDKGFVGFFL